MAAVEASVRNNKLTASAMSEVQKITATSLVAQAMSSGDANSIRDLLKKKGLQAPIENALRSMQIIQRNVRGSESEKDSLMPKFTALRIWSGCSSLFFTLNPHDIRSPITVLLLQDDLKLEKRFSLDTIKLS